MTSSTGSWPALGSGSGRKAGCMMPVIAPRPAVTSGSISKMLRERSSHGLVSMPPKPKEGAVIWKTCARSGTFMKTSAAFSEK